MSRVKYEYDRDSKKLFCFNSRLCNRLNRVLKQYDNGEYFFKAGEEGIIKIIPAMETHIMRVIEEFR